MNLFLEKMRVVFSVLPRELVAGIWRLILTIFLALLYLLKFVWERLRFKEKCTTPDWPRKPTCCKVPEQVKRKPDPCIYSQAYRMSQGLSVTWDNPDIVITKLNGTVIDSGSLQPGMNYIVNAKISNASFDPSLATEVRGFYRPWSFNSPDTMPIETALDGTEEVKILHISPWQSDVAHFNWHTPDQAGHYCLQVECRHPDDKNLNNNLGQENTNVVSGHTGEAKSIKALLVNNEDRNQKMRIFADRFMMPEGEMQLDLKILRIPLRKKHQFDFLHKRMLVNDVRKNSLSFVEDRVPFISRYAYTGWDELKKRFGRGQHPIPEKWKVRIEGNALEEGWTAFEMQPNERREIALAFDIPNDASSTENYILNFTAVNEHGKTLGGVSIQVIVNS